MIVVIQISFYLVFHLLFHFLDPGWTIFMLRNSELWCHMLLYWIWQINGLEFKNPTVCIYQYSCFGVNVKCFWWVLEFWIVLFWRLVCVFFIFFVRVYIVIFFFKYVFFEYLSAWFFLLNVVNMEDLLIRPIQVFQDANGLEILLRKGYLILSQVLLG